LRPMPDPPAAVTEELLDALREVHLTLGHVGHGLATRSDHPDAGWHPAEHRLVSRMSDKRRADFLGGRLAIRRALADARLPQPAGPILVGGNGEPALPDGVAASVSHSRGLAIALAAPATRFSSIGVDVEFAELPVGAAHLVLTEPERAWFERGCPPAERARRLLAAFSAKESVCKALDATLVGGSLRRIHLVPDGTCFLAWPRDRREPRLRVWVRRIGGGVLTWTAVPTGEHGPIREN
jgi:enterobactin synthetase component D